MLGYIYYNGVHVKKDIGKALQCYKKSAKFGDSEGWYKIGNMIEHG